MSLASIHFKKLFLCLTLLALAGCKISGERTGLLGNGEGFGGGDPFGGKLHALRNEILVPAARGILSQVDIAGLCDLSQCPQEEPLCQELPPLSAQQESECETLLLQLIPQLNQSLLNEDITLSGTTDSLSHDRSNVAALTSHKSTGSVIEVSYPRTQELGLDDLQLAALLAHEFFHTVLLNGELISDHLQFGSFTGVHAGSRLLDVLGTMVVAYWLRNGNTPAVLGGEKGSHLSFGHVRLGRTKELVLTVKNFGEERAENISVGNVDEPFTLINSTCNDGLGSGDDDECHLILRYEATSLQRHSTDLEVTYLASRRIRTLTVSMEGQGADPVLFAGIPNSGRVAVLDPFSGDPTAPELAVTTSLTTVPTAHCDVNGDGYLDVVTGSNRGARAMVRVFSGRDHGLLYQRDAYSGFLGGVDVACADVNGDGYGDAVTGAGWDNEVLGGTFGGPHVRVFSGADRLTTLLGDYFVTDIIPNQFGLVVEAADFDGDGYAEVVAGTGLGWGAEVYVHRYSASGMVPVTSLSRERLDLPPSQRAVYSAGSSELGVTLATGDIDGDGHPDLITGASQHGNHIKIYRLINNSLVMHDEFFSSNHDNQGVRVSSIDSNGDGIWEVITQSGLTGQINRWDPASGAFNHAGTFSTTSLIQMSPTLR